MLPGLHKVRQQRAGGRVAEYWYAWRGGPQILQVTASSDAALVKAVEREATAAIEKYKAETGPEAKSDDRFLGGLIARFLVAIEERTDLSRRTKADLREDIEAARTDLGAMEVKALEDGRARSVLLRWRDKWKDKPKSADKRLGALADALTWAHDRGDIRQNPLVDWPRLYKSNRADVIWEPQHQALILPELSTDEARDAVLFDAHSGLRLGDLIALPPNTVGEHAIVWQTNKSRGRKTIVVPITDAMRPILDRIVARWQALADDPKKPTPTTLLVSSRGRPWSEAGFESAVQKARNAAVEKLEKAGRDPGPIKRLRIHDLRGTAVTNYVRAGLPLEDIATIVGWSKARVEAIALKYVTGQEVGLAIVERMRRNAAGTPAVNGL